MPYFEKFQDLGASSSHSLGAICLLDGVIGPL